MLRQPQITVRRASNPRLLIRSLLSGSVPAAEAAVATTAEGTLTAATDRTLAADRTLTADRPLTAGTAAEQPSSTAATTTGAMPRFG